MHLQPSLSLKWPWFPPSLSVWRCQKLPGINRDSSRSRPIAGTQDSNEHAEKSELENWLYTQVQRWQPRRRRQPRGLIIADASESARQGTAISKHLGLQWWQQRPYARDILGSHGYPCNPSSLQQIASDCCLHRRNVTRCWISESAL